MQLLDLLRRVGGGEAALRQQQGSDRREAGISLRRFERFKIDADGQ